MTGGRPLRFLGLLLCGWTGMRAFALYREGGTAALVAPLTDALATVVDELGIAPAQAAEVRFVGVRKSPRTPVARIAPASIMARTGGAVQASATAHEAPSVRAAGPPQDVVPRPSLLPLAALPPPIAHGSSRWAGSAWGIARGGGIAQASGGQLGGSQAGVRVTYALGTSRRVALAARLSTPLAGRGTEGAIGLDWQPTRLPIHVLAERRFAIDGGRGGAMLGVVGGFGPAPVVGRVTLEGYGQAGVIARDAVEGFADGAVRVAHPIARLGTMRLDLGVGAWGGVQRGAARLDTGPSLGLVVPLGGRAVRLTADWRQRIAGDARPGSGPALSIGTDF